MRRRDQVSGAQQRVPAGRRSGSNTSSPAPPIRPSWSARSERLLVHDRAAGRVDQERRRLHRREELLADQPARVGLQRRVELTKSTRVQSSSRPTGSTPRLAWPRRRREGAWARTRMPKALRLAASARPMFPKPTIPSVRAGEPGGRPRRGRGPSPPRGPPGRRRAAVVRTRGSSRARARRPRRRSTRARW